jgi:hypothetical protein
MSFSMIIIRDLRFSQHSVTCHSVWLEFEIFFISFTPCIIVMFPQYQPKMHRVVLYLKTLYSYMFWPFWSIIREFISWCVHLLVEIEEIWDSLSIQWLSFSMIRIWDMIFSQHFVTSHSVWLGFEIWDSHISEDEGYGLVGCNFLWFVDRYQCLGHFRVSWTWTQHCFFEMLVSMYQTTWHYML